MRWFKFLIWGVGGVALFLLFEIAQAGQFGIGVTPAEIKAGDKVTIRVWATGTFPDHPQPPNHISLFVTEGDQSPPSTKEELCQRANNSGTMHLKKITEDIDADGDTYIWDTQAEGSSKGKHYIVAALMASDRSTACDPNNVIRINDADYTVTPTATPPPGGGGGTTNGGGAPEIKFPAISITPPGSGTFDPTKENTPLGGNNWIKELMVRIINKMLQIGGALALIALIYSGIMYITSAGNPQKAEIAKKNIIWAITAIVIITLALLIIGWIPQILSKNPT